MRVKVIINPAAGKPEPVLSILNDVFGEAGIDWDAGSTPLEVSVAPGAVGVVVPKGTVARDAK
jgi:hypothetical protein